MDDARGKVFYASYGGRDVCWADQMVGFETRDLEHRVSIWGQTPEAEFQIITFTLPLEFVIVAVRGL